MSYNFFCGDVVFHCTAENEAREFHLHELCLFLIFLSAWVFFVLFIFFVGRRLHLKWPCILKVLATGDDNH